MRRLMLVAALVLGVSAWAQTTTNKSEKAKTETKKPEVEEKEEEKPRPSFKPKERIPVDQGVDFPVDI